LINNKFPFVPTHQLLTDDLVDVLVVDGQTAVEVDSQLRKYLEDIRAVTARAKNVKSDGNNVSVVNFRLVELYILFVSK